MGEVGIKKEKMFMMIGARLGDGWGHLSEEGVGRKALVGEGCGQIGCGQSVLKKDKMS